MPYEIADEVQEEFLLDTYFTVSEKSLPIRIAVSKQAIYLPRTKAFAVKDPTYFERVPLENVTEVRVHRLKPYFLWALAAIMVAVGGYTTVVMMAPILAGAGGKVTGIPPAVALCGAVIPFLARRRFSLDVKSSGKPFRWKPTLVVDKKSRLAVEAFIGSVADACRKAGIPVVDERG